MYVDGSIPRGAVLLYRLRKNSFEVYCLLVIALCFIGVTLLHAHLGTGRFVIGRVLPIAFVVLIFWPSERGEVG